MTLTRSFSPATVDGRIVSLLDRVSQAFRVVLWEATKEEGLSPIQIQFLLYIGRSPWTLSTVTHLSREFSLTRATVSDAISSLERKKLLTRVPHPSDRRSATLSASVQGKKVIRRLLQWENSITAHISRLPRESKEIAMLFLMELIKSFHASGMEIMVRMCLTCDNFRENAHPGADKPHHCSLTNTPIGTADLQVNCHSHRPRNNPDTRSSPWTNKY